MVDVSGFTDVDQTILEARKTFRAGARKQMRDVGTAVSVSLVLVKFAKASKKIREWSDERTDDVIRVITKCLHMVIGIIYLSESGLYDLAGPLLRNYSELLLVGLAISYDEQCYIDWKNERQEVSTFAKLKKRVEVSTSVPEHHKRETVPAIADYWSKASAHFSHQLSKNVVRDVLDGLNVNLGINVLSENWQIKRLNLVVILCLNICTIMVQAFDYSELIANRKGGPDVENPVKVYDILFHEYKNIDDLT